MPGFCGFGNLGELMTYFGYVRKFLAQCCTIDGEEPPTQVDHTHGRGSMLGLEVAEVETLCADDRRRGEGLPALQRLLGHDHLATTEIYLNLSPEHVLQEYRDKG